MTHVIGAKGQVVIPKELREAVGLRPGTRATFALDAGRVVVTAAPTDEPVPAGRFDHSGMAAALLADRAR
ncbi:MAG: AbrB/MazE/SpoVT family DNA-binding domain-containing protein [Candidatus Dormiibacterota bacterium]